VLFQQVSLFQQTTALHHYTTSHTVLHVGRLLGASFGIPTKILNKLQRSDSSSTHQRIKKRTEAQEKKQGKQAGGKPDSFCIILFRIDHPLQDLRQT